ncbi:MAG: ATP synthase F1 subunit delta [Odoribacteraceae bacterium]|jgi:F-type H+-transporting ATPase subunit delta|nr:ATP synthase F1 subunit delta [Odoribacteraceae bacterium]
MDEGLISRRYAKALFHYAGEPEVQRLIYEKMKLFQESDAAHPGLQKALQNPVLPSKTKETLLATAMGLLPPPGAEGHAILRLIRLVLRNHREMYMKSIARMYEEVYRTAHDMARVKVTTAVALLPAMREKVEAFARKRSGKRLEFIYRVEPAIVGGIILEIGDRQYDASVSRKLREIRVGFLKK